ncbi:hypothetical protein HRR88_006135 [Exophiala dermatitidis]|nr:hypothetical protein HRR88_006135 [Exophiala dermatitidis]
MVSSRSNNGNTHPFGSSSSPLTSTMSLGQAGSFAHIEHAEAVSDSSTGTNTPTSRTSSSPIDIPMPRRSASIEAEAGSQPFSWDRPGNNEAVDFHVDNSIARRTRAEMHLAEAEAEADSESESADNWSTRANAGDDDDNDSGYNSSHEGTELWGHGGIWPVWSMELEPFASSWSYTSRRLPGSHRIRRRNERTSPPPPPPSPEPAAEGRREHYRVVPLVEADDTDGFEVPWIPLIGRIEDLLSWPVGSPRPARRGMIPVVAEEEEE